VLAIVAAVVLANLPSLLHLVTVNPLDLQTHLGALSTQGALAGFPSIDPNDGVTTQALGHLAGLDWISGHIPWWNTYEGVGVPLAGEMASASFFPLVLILLFSGGVIFFHMALELVAGLATYFLARRLGLGTSASLAAGIAFALNGTFSWLGDATVNPIPFLPLLLLGIELVRSVEVSAQRWGRLLIGLSLALSIYAGFPETTALDALFAGVWFLLRLEGLARSEAWRWLRRTLYGLALGLLLAAPLIIAFLDYVVHADLGGHGSGFSGIYLPRSGIAMVSLPYVFGPIFGLYGSDPTGTLGAIWSGVGGYVTPSLVALASLAAVGALIRRQDRWLRLGLVVWIILSLSTTFGVPALGGVLELVPGVSHTAFFRYAPPSWELATILLAAMAIDDLAHARATSRVVWTSLGVTLFAWLISAALAFRLIAHLRAAAHIHLYAGASLVWALLLTAAVAATALLRLHGRGRLQLHAPKILAAAVALDVLAMFIVPQFSAPPKATLDSRPIRFLQAHLGLERFFTLGPIQPDYGSYYQISEANTADLPIPQLWAQYVTTRLAPNTNPITFSGYQVNSLTGPSPWQQFVTYFKNYERIGVKFLVVPTSDAPRPIPSRLGLRKVFADNVTTIYRLPNPSPLFQSISPGCNVKTLDPSKVVVRCNSPTTIVRREMYFPGWTATVGGRLAPITRTESIFQAVHVPAGRSTIRFDYQPEYISVGLLAGLIGLALVLGQLGFMLWVRAGPCRRTGSAARW
jgi:hypothetical protein